MTKAIRKLSEPKALLVAGIVYTLLVTVAFLSPATDVPRVNIPYLDKVFHVLIHCALSLLWLGFVYANDKYHISIKIVIVVLVLCFSYGIAIEMAQHYFTVSRQFDLLDIIANSCGSLLGLLSFNFVRSRIVH